MMLSRSSLALALMLVFGSAGACSPSSATPGSGGSGASTSASGGAGGKGGAGVGGAGPGGAGGGTATGTGAAGGDGGSGTTGGGAAGGSGGATTTDTGAGGGGDLDGGSGGQGGINPDAACAATSSEAKSELEPADIVIAVDTSGSMDQEADEVQNNLNAFAAIITGSGIDVHVILIAAQGVCIPAPLGSGNCPGDEKLPAYRHLVQGVSSTNALELILATYPSWKGSLRPNAAKIIAVVSDDNSDMGAAEFTQKLLALDPPTFQGFTFDAIVSFTSPDACVFGGCFFNCAACQDPCCDKAALCTPLSAAEGTVYKQLVKQTGGVIGDLCAQDFDPVFKDMAKGVVQNAGIACEYEIPKPDAGMVDPDKVNVGYTSGAGGPSQTIPNVPGGAAACGNQGGWYYDDPKSPTKIIMCPKTCSALQGDPNGKVEVLFGCSTIHI